MQYIKKDWKSKRNYSKLSHVNDIYLLKFYSEAAQNEAETLRMSLNNAIYEAHSNAGAG